jgi:MFS family permease
MKSRAPNPILFFSLVIIMIGFGITIPLMPFYITHFNASGSALGLMMSIYSLMQFVFAPMWGRLSDRIGRKPVLLTGILGYAISFILQGISQNIVQLILLRSLAGIISSATLPQLWPISPIPPASKTAPKELA